MNGKSKSGEPCIICLNEKKTHQMRGIDCDCKYYIHQSCHVEYVNHNHKMECPICHVISTPNPIHTIYIKKEDLYKESDSSNNCVNGCIGGCCFSLVILAIVFAVLS